jgi:hypothetical protein
VSRLAHHDARTLFGRAWAYGIRTGIITDLRREQLIEEGTKAIRRIATVLGTEFLRGDLERAMRSMLGLVDLQLHKVSMGDVDMAAHSLADHGLLFHTRGASRALKRMIAIEHGLGPDELEALPPRRFEEQVVTECATAPHEEIVERELYAEALLRMRVAAASISRLLEGEPPDDYHEPEQVLMTAVLTLAFGHRRWITDRRGFEALLGQLRADPRRLDALPPGLPADCRAMAEEVREIWAPRLVATVTDPKTPLHRLISGDPLSNPLHAWLVLPADAIGEVDDLDEQVSSHWQALTKGARDEAQLLWVLLQGVHGVEAKPPLAWKPTEALLRTALAEPSAASAVADWLDANAPHEYHAGLVSLWEDFSDELAELLEDGGAAQDLKRFMATWLPMKAAAAQPAREKAPPAKRAAAGKAAPKQTGAAQAPAKKAAAKKPATKKPATKKPAAKKPAAKKAAAKKAAAKKAATKHAPAKKAPAKKTPVEAAPARKGARRAAGAT